MNITKENYEAFIIDYLEGNLSPDEIAELMHFVHQHPGMELDFLFFHSAHLHQVHYLPQQMRECPNPDYVKSANVQILYFC